MENAPPRDRHARPDRVPRELVAEVNVRGVDLEQLPALRLLRRGRPAGHHRVEHGCGHAARHDRHQLHEAPPGVVEPGRAPRDRARHGRRQVVRGP